jgi:uncharacterized protein YoxC
MNYVTWTDLTFAIGFVLGCILCIYLIVLVKNLNTSVSAIKKLLKANTNNIDEALKKLPAISQNILEISDTAKDEMKAIGPAVKQWSETVEATATTVHTIENDFLSKIKGVIDFIELLIKILFKDDKKTK